MDITAEAQKRLAELLGKAPGRPSGLRLQGYIGTCRGSTPVLKPADGPEEGDATVQAGQAVLYVAGEYRDLMETARLDYDGSLMGAGLTLTWPHREGCACHGRLKAEG